MKCSDLRVISGLQCGSELGLQHIDLLPKKHLIGLGRWRRTCKHEGLFESQPYSKSWVLGRGEMDKYLKFIAQLAYLVSEFQVSWETLSQIWVRGSLMKTRVSKSLQAYNSYTCMHTPLNIHNLSYPIGFGVVSWVWLRNWFCPLLSDLLCIK